jgi:hypothetical protein
MVTFIKVMFIKIFVVVVLALALIGWLADRRAAASSPDVTPGLCFFQAILNTRVQTEMFVSTSLS